MQLSEERFLEGYDPSQFERPSVTVDVLVFTVYEKELRLLLVKRDAYPFMGRWALPGGFIGITETADESAARIVREKAGVSGVHLEQLYTFSSVKRDPRTRVLSVAYLAVVPYGKLRYGAGTGTSVASLFAVGGVDGSRLDTGTEGMPVYKEWSLMLTGPDGNVVNGMDLAFDHADIIRTAVLRMRGKIDYTDLAFGFLNDPCSFSIKELRHMYEAVLGHPVDAGNFRRTIKREYEAKGRIVKHGLEKGVVGRPSELYRISNV